MNRLPVCPQRDGDCLARLVGAAWRGKINFGSSRVRSPHGFVGSGERPTARAFQHSDRSRWFQQPARPADKWLTRPSVGRGLMISPFQDIEN